MLRGYETDSLVLIIPYILVVPTSLMVICLQQFYEIIEEELRVDRTAACFRVELCREPRIRFVSNALV